MTINSSVSRVDYVGNGTTTAFAVPFAFFDASELRVVSRVIATGVETVLALTTNYTVSGGGGANGTVTAVVAPASTVQWSILRATRRTQDVDFQANDPFPAETLERGLDRVVAVVQEIERDQLRSIRAAETDSTSSLTLPTQAERANRVLGFDAAGNPVPVVPQAGSLAVTPYALTILSAPTADAARGALGATAVGDALMVAADAGPARVALEMDRSVTTVAAGAAAVLLDIPAAWRAARLIGVGMRGTVATAQVLVQFRRVGQGAEDSGASSYLSAFIGRTSVTSANAVTSGNTSAGSIGLTFGIDSTVAPSGMFEAVIDTGAAGGFAQIIGTARGFELTSFDQILMTGGRLALAGQINRIRLLWNAGNWNAGTIILERVA